MNDKTDGATAAPLKAPAPRQWSKKTLTRELVKFAKGAGLKEDATIAELLEKLRGAILVEEGVGDLSL